jgi:hypothetical protein
VSSKDAQGRWEYFYGKKRAFITRCEKYAAFTIPKLCTPVGYHQNSNELQHDFQAVGAQAVNFLANKIMLALFAPSQPFFRLDADTQLLTELTKANVTADMLANMLAQGEKQAVAKLDQLALRPKLYEAIKHLIVTGNALLCLDTNDMRVIGLKNYAVRRSMSGKVLELMIMDCLMFDELEPEVQEYAVKFGLGGPNGSEQEVKLYRWIKRNAAGDYEMTQWVNQFQLPVKFAGKWPEDQLPYRVMTWDLSDDAHYGTGLVEDYQGDFAGLSMLSKAEIEGAVLSSEFRWLVNPAGMTRPEDFMNSPNGAAIPGMKDDVTIVQSNKAGDLQVVNVFAQEYIRRIGQGFLLGTAVTRNAERVTAEEIRMQAQELETSLGGAYSRLAVDFQIPIAYWLLIQIGFNLLDGQGQHVRPSIVTGLDALSRNGDLDDLKLWLADMAALANLPPILQGQLKMDAIAQALALPRRINITAFIKSPAEQQAEQQAYQQQQQEAAAQQAGADTGSKIAVENAKQGTP